MIVETTPVKSKKPFGFYVCALGFTFERMAFYTAKYMLAIWIATTAASGGLGMTSAQGVQISAWFVASEFNGHGVADDYPSCARYRFV